MWKYMIYAHLNMYIICFLCGLYSRDIYVGGFVPGMAVMLTGKFTSRVALAADDKWE